MKLNLKSTVVASLLLISTISFAQTTTDSPTAPASTPVASPVNTNTPVTTNALVANITGVEKNTPGCKCDDVVKKPVVKKKIKPKKVAKKPVKVAPKEINIVSQNNIIEEKVPFSEYYDYKDVKLVASIVPTEESKKWVSDFSNNDNIKPKLTFTAIDKEGNPYPIENFIFNKGTNLTVIQLNTDLSKINESKTSVDTVFDPLFTKNNCQAIFVKYQLKGNKESNGTRFFLNNEGALENSLPANCKTSTKDERDSTDYSSLGYISNVSFTKIISHHSENVEFIFHLVKNGKDYFGKNAKAYIVNNQFDDIYIPSITPHRKGPYFGTTFINSPVKAGLYNIVIPFEADEGKQFVQVSRTVQ